MHLINQSIDLFTVMTTRSIIQPEGHGVNDHFTWTLPALVDPDISILKASSLKSMAPVAHSGQVSQTTHRDCWSCSIRSLYRNAFATITSILGGIESDNHFVGRKRFTTGTTWIAWIVVKIVKCGITLLCGTTECWTGTGGGGGMSG